MTGDSHPTEQGSGKPLEAPQSREAPLVGTERRPGGEFGPQAATDGFDGPEVHHWDAVKTAEVARLLAAHPPRNVGWITSNADQPEAPMPDPTPADELQQRLDSVRGQIKAAADHQPSPEQLAEWAAADKELARRINKLRPGVPVHQAFHVLDTLRAIQHIDAAPEPTPAPARECAASTSRNCLAEGEGYTGCATEDGECLHAPASALVGLRDQIAAAIWERQNPGRRYADCEHPWMADAEEDADAVLRVPAIAEAVGAAARVRDACDQLTRAALNADGVPLTPRDEGTVRAADRILAALDPQEQP